MNSKLWPWLVALAVVALPEAAMACSVCPLGSGRNTTAYYVSGVLISVTQCLSLGSLIWWYRKRSRDTNRPDR